MRLRPFCGQFVLGEDRKDICLASLDGKHFIDKYLMASICYVRKKTSHSIKLMASRGSHEHVGPHQNSGSSAKLWSIIRFWKMKLIQSRVSIVTLNQSVVAIVIRGGQINRVWMCVRERVRETTSRTEHRVIIFFLTNVVSRSPIMLPIGMASQLAQYWRSWFHSCCCVSWLQLDTTSSNTSLTPSSSATSEWDT